MNGSDVWTYEFAKGTRMDYVKYANGTDFGSSASCASVAASSGTTSDDLVKWNPTLASGCTLNGRLTCCVRQYTLRPHNMTGYCTMEDEPGPGTSCEKFLDLWRLDYETFADFNPGIGQKCENWQLGEFSDLRPEYCRPY
jgi:hypothetical protein